MPTKNTDKQQDYGTRGSGAPADNLSLDTTFEVLKNSRRRLVLDNLRGHEQAIELSELADIVTAEENDTEVSAITSTERKRVYVGLYQFHLPKMDDMGIIDFDQDRGTIELTTKGQQLLKAHDRSSAQCRPWHYLYLGLAAVGLLAAGLSLWSGSWMAPGLLVVQSLALAVLAVLQAIDYHGGISVVLGGRNDSLSSGNVE